MVVLTVKKPIEFNSVVQRSITTGSMKVYENAFASPRKRREKDSSQALTVNPLEIPRALNGKICLCMKSKQ